MVFGFKRRSGDEAPPASAIREITGEAELLEALPRGPAVIYKHSDRCPMCFLSNKEIEKFSRGRPEVPVLKIDVVGSRRLSDLVAERFGIRHESPQAILVQDGQVTWDASHLAVTAKRLEAAHNRPSHRRRPASR